MFVLPRVGLSFTGVVKILCLHYNFKYKNNNCWREIAFFTCFIHRFCQFLTNMEGVSEKIMFVLEQIWHDFSTP
jgi:hypothetical protein